MRTIGYIGRHELGKPRGLYRGRVNDLVRERLGGLHSAKLIMHPSDFRKHCGLLQKKRCMGPRRAVSCRSGARPSRLPGRGPRPVAFLLHQRHAKLADTVAPRGIDPAAATAPMSRSAITAAGCRRPLLLATRYPMERIFTPSRGYARHGLFACRAGCRDRTAVHDSLHELCCAWFAKHRGGVSCCRCGPPCRRRPTASSWAARRFAADRGHSISICRCLTSDLLHADARSLSRSKAH